MLLQKYMDKKITLFPHKKSRHFFRAKFVISNYPEFIPGSCECLIGSAVLTSSNSKTDYMADKQAKYLNKFSNLLLVTHNF